MAFPFCTPSDSISLHELLRDAAVKSQFASFLPQEGLIERLAQMTHSTGLQMKRLASPNAQAQTDWNQLSLNSVSSTLRRWGFCSFWIKKKFDGLYQAVTAPSQQEVEQSVKVGLGDLSKLAQASGIRLRSSLRKLITALAVKNEVDTEINQALTQ